MLKISENPGLILFISLVIGLLSGIYLLSTFQIALLSLGLLVLSTLSYKLFPSFSFIFISLIIGLVLSFEVNSTKINFPDKIIQPRQAHFIGKTIKLMKNDSSKTKLLAKGKIRAKGLPTIENERIYLTIYKNNRDIRLMPGSEFMASVRIRIPAKAQFDEDFPERQYLRSISANWIATTSDKNVTLLGNHSKIELLQNEIIDYIHKAVNSNFSQKTRGAVIALATGDKSHIDYTVKREFSLSGTSHVLAISGLHIGLVAFVIFLLTGFIHNGILRIIVFSIILGVFVILTGMQPSAIRASLMAILILIVNQSQREVYPINIISIAASFVLIFNPSMIFSVSFQLSVLAVLGIILFSYTFYEKLSKLIRLSGSAKKYIIGSFSVTLASTVTVGPLVAYYFDVFSIISPFTNLLVIPLISLSLVYSYISIIFYSVLPWLSEVFASSADTLLSLSIDINSYAAGFEGFYLEGWWAMFAAISFSIASIYTFSAINSRLFIFRFIASVCIIICLAYQFPEKSRKPEVLPRQRYVAVKVPIADSITYVMLSGRYPEDYATMDWPMVNHLVNTQDSLIISYDGNSGKKLAEKIKEKRNAAVFLHDYHFQNKIQNKLNIKTSFQKIIDNNYEKH